MNAQQLVVMLKTMKVGEKAAICTLDHFYYIEKKNYPKQNKLTTVFYDEFEPMIITASDREGDKKP